MRYTRLTLSILSILIPAWLCAQSPVFSQYYAAGLYLNPALAGVEKDLTAGINYRSQWANANLPYKTCQLSFIHPIISEAVQSKHLGGWGISILNDESGPNREFVSQSISLSGTYNLHLSQKGNNIISAGLQFSMLQQKLNTESFRWSSQYSASYGFDNTLPGETNFDDRVISPVFHAGLLWSYTLHARQRNEASIFQGLAVSNLNKPASFIVDNSVSLVLMKLHGGFSTTVADDIEISPNYLIQYQDQLQVNIGSYASYPIYKVLSSVAPETRFTAGLWYRFGDAIILNAGLTTDTWSFAISYDTNTQSMQRNLGSTNSFELSATYRFNKYKGHHRFSSPLI